MFIDKSKVRFQAEASDSQDHLKTFSKSGRSEHLWRYVIKAPGEETNMQVGSIRVESNGIKSMSQGICLMEPAGRGHTRKSGVFLQLITLWSERWGHVPRRETRRRLSGTGAWVGAPARGAGKPSRWTQGVLSCKSHLGVQVPLSSCGSFLCPIATEAEKVAFWHETSVGIEMSHTFLRCGEGTGGCGCRGGRGSTPRIQAGDAVVIWKSSRGLEEAGRWDRSLCTYAGLRGLEAGTQSLSLLMSDSSLVETHALSRN